MILHYILIQFFGKKKKIFSFLQKAKIFIDSNILQDFLLGFGIGIWAVGNHMSVTSRVANVVADHNDLLTQ